jgi:hypothetical protein
LYERDPFTNKPIKIDPTPEHTKSTLLMPGQTTTFNTITPHSNGYSSIIFPNQTVTLWSQKRTKFCRIYRMKILVLREYLCQVLML